MTTTRLDLNDYDDVVPVRCTIIKLKDGGLFIHNPVAPTPECVDLVRDLERNYGTVKYIVLGTLGVEHKGTVGVFSSYFPSSEVYYQPGQYSFPIDFPVQFFFPISKRIKEIPSSNAEAPWSEDIDHEVLSPLRPPGAGGFGETAFFHRATKTLLVTDSIVRVDDEPPAIVQDDPRALLYHARNTVDEIIIDSPEVRRRGWRRIVLFALTFQPSGIRVKDLFESIKSVNKVNPQMRILGRGTIPLNEGLYPWDWVEDDKPNFRALQGGLLVAPILQILIFNREPKRVIDWVNRVAKWPFKRIIPCHLSNDLAATPSDFKRAFDFLFEDEKTAWPLLGGPRRSPQVNPADAKLLEDISVQLTAQGTLYPAAPKMKRNSNK